MVQRNIIYKVLPAISCFWISSTPQVRGSRVCNCDLTTTFLTATTLIYGVGRGIIAAAVTTLTIEQRWQTGGQ